MGTTLEPTECWKVTGIMTAEAFFRAVPGLLPDGTRMFLEGTPAPDIMALLAASADGSDYAAPRGTIWSWPRQDRQFVVRVSAALLDRLSEAASRHAEPEVCSHVHFHAGGLPLLQWFDAFSAPLLVSKSVSRERMERFASAAGGILSDGAA